ncbi:hypothetical protein GCM10009430_36730 [Aquimarina litoralis]|uniref:Uncharacterized protein n=1 Tax=Aquimarina litoralis TaxID=584605 RepID=A0ABN1J446_9FLAO
MKKTKYKEHLSFPEHPAIPFDVHFLSIKEKDKRNTPEKFQYMKKYKSEGAIMDFYKKNSNILDLS